MTHQPIVVTGGTGTLGRLVVDRLVAGGNGVRIVSRSAPAGDLRPEVTHAAADLTTGHGVEDALTGAEVVVHCAGSQTGDGDKARHLVAAARAAGVRHLVNISVVGADRVPQTGRLDRMMFGYFGSKLEAEQVISRSGIGWTTVRATQFHDLMLMAAQGMARLPVVPVPSGLRFQPVDAGEVADRLVSLALGAPAGLVPDLAGPEVHTLRSLVGSYLEVAGKHRLLMPLRLPGRAAAAFRSGANLSPDHATGHRTWSDFLADRIPTPDGPTVRG